MQQKFLKSLSFLLLTIFFSVPSVIFAQNIPIDNFESYNTTDDLKADWTAFGFSTLDYALAIDSANTDFGTRSFEYVYSGNDQTTWGGAISNKSLAASPLDLSGTEGIKFMLKGDGSSNVIYIRISNGDNSWSSNKIALLDTNWHSVTIPFAVDTANGFTNGAKTITDLYADLANVTDFRIYLDHPAIENITYKIRFNTIYALKSLPPDGIMIDDFENYNTVAQLKAVWGFFGYSTADYNPIKDPENSPSGFQYLDYKYRAGSTTTWGSAFRVLSIQMDLSNVQSGLQFYMKGDGSDNHIYVRLDNGNEMYSSYFIPLKDTTWHLVKIDFLADTTTGFRYVGNNPDNGPDYTLDPGTNEQLRTHLASITGMRIVIDKPVIDDVLYITGFDAIYAVDVYSDGTVVPVELTSFSAAKNGSSVELNWATATETNNRGFEVQRKLDSKWQTIGFIEGKGTTTLRTTYKFADDISGITSSSILYRLKQVDLNGTFEYSNEVNVSNIQEFKYELAQNYPNPFNPSTTIKYQTTGKDFVSLKVYNILGKEVASLVNGVQNPGNHEAVFNAKNLSSGIYFYTLQSGSFNVTKKMILLK